MKNSTVDRPPAIVTTMFFPNIENKIPTAAITIKKTPSPSIKLLLAFVPKKLTLTKGRKVEKMITILAINP